MRKYFEVRKPFGVYFGRLDVYNATLKESGRDSFLGLFNGMYH